jgi:hypothetical protein
LDVRGYNDRDIYDTAYCCDILFPEISPNRHDLWNGERRGMTNRKRYFSDVMHDILIVILVLGMILIAQQLSKGVYKVGVIMLAVATFLQIGFGNIPEKTRFGRSMKLLGIALFIIVFVFGLGVLLAPVFVNFVRG